MNYLDPDEYSLTNSFLKHGYIIAETENQSSLDKIRAKLVEVTCNYLNLDFPEDHGLFLDHIHEVVRPDQLNDLKLEITSTLMGETWFKHAYYSTARTLINKLVGNELVVQKNIGFGVLLPEDYSSIVRLHSDTWGSECSPFEVVLWIPFVDCFRTKSIFICPPEKDKIWRKRLKELAGLGIEELYKNVESDLVWPSVKYGEVMLFTPTVMHGGRVNEELTSRWSMNLRFKSLFSPYAGKRLGEYFEPITIRGASKIGIEFEYPEDHLE